MSRKFKPPVNAPVVASPLREPRVRSVLFLCIGNSCRSQMAEGFARTYGSDVITPLSAGLAPALIVQPLTYKVMLEKNITLDGQFPKDLASINLGDVDLLINMSGRKLPTRDTLSVEDWPVEDPIAKSEKIYLEVRNQIELRVMRLILQLRSNS